MTKQAELEAIQALSRLAADRNSNVKISAAQGLARYVHMPEAIEILSRLATDRHSGVKEAAARALGGRV